MKFLSGKFITLSLCLLLAIGAYAANDVHKGTLLLGAQIVVGGKQLPAGAYQVKWEGAGPDVSVNILQDGKAVATTPAKVVQLSDKSSDDVAELQTAADGSKRLSQIRFSGKNYALTFDQNAAQTQAQANSGNSGK